MFPTIEKYIQEKYKTKNKDVEISNKLNKEIVKVSNQVILLAEKNIHIPFYDIIEMKEILLKECEKNVKN